MNYLQIDQAVRNRADWYRTKLIPEAPVRYKATQERTLGSGKHAYTYLPQLEYFADYIGVSEAGYATELEVKISRADWRVDRDKSKWENLPPWITRFIYVVPEGLGIPDWVWPFAGVWHLRTVRVRHSHNKVEVDTFAHVVRAPRRIGKEKVPEKVMEGWMRGFYYRYWRQRIDRHADKMEMLHKRAPYEVRTTKAPENLPDEIEL